MRSRNREVNIFNMSLLDILTGMMGAFLFLMLGMVPYYSKVKSEEQNPQQQNQGNGGGQQGPQIDAILQATATWNSDAKLEFFLYNATSKVWDSINTKSPFLPHGANISDGSSGRGDGWESTGDYVSPPDDHDILIVAIPAPKVPEVIDPKSYSTLHLTTELTLLSSKANAGGVASFSPIFISLPLDTSELKPGHAYAICYINVTRDTTKEKFYQQYHYEWDVINPATDHLPSGVIPMLHPWK